MKTQPTFVVQEERRAHLERRGAQLDDDLGGFLAEVA
jgi:hypothetical protein